MRAAQQHRCLQAVEKGAVVLGVGKAKVVRAVVWVQVLVLVLVLVPVLVLVLVLVPVHSSKAGVIKRSSAPAARLEEARPPPSLCLALPDCKRWNRPPPARLGERAVTVCKEMLLRESLAAPFCRSTGTCPGGYDVLRPACDRAGRCLSRPADQFGMRAGTC